MKRMTHDFAARSNILSLKLITIVLLATALVTAAPAQIRSQSKQTNSARPANGNTKTFTPQGFSSN